MTAIKQPEPSASPWIETPLIESRALSKEAGCRVFLKLENLQPSGSFKSRGIGNLLLQAINTPRAPGDDGRPIHFYASSGGNAGLACVVAAVALGCQSTIVVPLSTEESMVSKLCEAGASKVIVHGSNWYVADRYLRDVIMPEAEKMGEKTVYVPPFDHPDIWAGASTMIPEIKRQLPDGVMPDAVVCSVGGGGLFAGIMEGIGREAWPTRVLAVETLGADSLAQAVAHRELVALPEITSIAKSLGAPMVAQRALDYALQPSVSTVVVEDAEACYSCLRFANDERTLVEPACGASLAVVYGGRLRTYLEGMSAESVVVIIVCGGSRIDLQTLYLYERQFGINASAV